MGNRESHQHQPMNSVEGLMSLIRELGIDLVGVADLQTLEGMPMGIPGDTAGFLQRYRRAIVLGAQFGKFGPTVSNTDIKMYLEKSALHVLSHLEGKGFPGLIIHCDDEFDPVNRLGLLSLKVLAKGAGLGWQGRSLLIVSPEYGPVHRWIAILTNLELPAGEPMPNQCGDCRACIDACPPGALQLVPFDDHPGRREDVLNLSVCEGDGSCTVCIEACPWLKQRAAQ